MVTRTGQPLDEAAADLALRASHYLRTRFRDRVTIEDLSAYLAYSPSHLTRVFTAAVGTSPMDYLAAWRLHEAKHLLVAHRMAWPRPVTKSATPRWVPSAGASCATSESRPAPCVASPTGSPSEPCRP